MVTSTVVRKSVLINRRTFVMEIGRLPSAPLLHPACRGPPTAARRTTCQRKGALPT